jgi:hypothetical protein
LRLNTKKPSGHHRRKPDRHAGGKHPRAGREEVEKMAKFVLKTKGGVMNRHPRKSARINERRRKNGKNSGRLSAAEVRFQRAIIREKIALLLHELAKLDSRC